MKSIVYKSAICLTDFSSLVVNLDRLLVYYSSLSNEYIIKSPYFRNKDAYIGSTTKMLEFVLSRNHKEICTDMYCLDHSASRKLDLNLGLAILHYSMLVDKKKDSISELILSDIDNYTLSLGITLINRWGILYTLYAKHNKTNFVWKLNLFNYKHEFILGKDVDDYFSKHKQLNSAVREKVEIIYKLSSLSDGNKNYIDFILNNCKLDVAR